MELRSAAELNPNAGKGSISDAALLVRGAGITDSIGTVDRPLYPLQYMQCNGTGYFASAEITGNETVVAHGGTSIPTIAAGRINATSGTLWSVELTNGSRYEYATLITTSLAIIFDVSGYGRHLVASTSTGWTTTTLPDLCAAGREYGTDWINQRGLEPAVYATGTELSGNVEFLTNTWWTKNAGCTIAGGVCTVNVGASQNILWANIGISAAKSYIVTITITSFSSGTFGVGAGGDNLQGLLAAGNIGTFQFRVKPVAPNGYIVIGSGQSGCVMTLDSVSIKEIYDDSKLIPMGAGRVSVPPIVKMWGDSFTVQLGNQWVASHHNFTPKGVGGETSAQIKTRFDAGSDYTSTTLICAGINDIMTGVPVATLLANIDAMANALKTTRFLICGIFPKADQITGTSQHTNCLAVNSYLLGKYGNVESGGNFWDWFQYIRSRHNPSLPQDVIDYNNGVHPTSLRADVVHLNDVGWQYSRVELIRILVSRGWYTGYPDRVDGRAKYNLTLVSDMDRYSIADAGQYKMPDAGEIRVASGWQYGTANDFYDASGVPLSISGENLKNAGSGPILWVGGINWVVFRDLQSAKAAVGSN